MVFDVKNTKGKKVKIYDSRGTQILNAFKYNTRTREVSLYLYGKNALNKDSVVMFNRSHKDKKGYTHDLVRVKVKVPGSFIIVNGKRY